MYLYIIGWVKYLDKCSATCRMVKNHNERRHLVTSTNVFSYLGWGILVSDSETTDCIHRLNYRTN